MINYMNTERITVSLPEQSVAFVNNYKQKNEMKSTSQVILKALQLLEKEAMFDMFTEMGKQNEENDSVNASEAEAEGFLDESW